MTIKYLVSDELTELIGKFGKVGCVYMWSFKGSPVYIGITMAGLGRRIKDHLSAAEKGSNLPLERLIHDNKEEDFEVSILYFSEDPYKVLEKEEFFIREKETHISQGGCNIRRSGDRYAHLKSLGFEKVDKVKAIKEKEEVIKSKEYMSEVKQDKLRVKKEKKIRREIESLKRKLGKSERDRESNRKRKLDDEERRRAVRRIVLELEDKEPNN